MANRFFTDDIPDIEDNNYNEDRNYNDNSNGNKGSKLEMVFGIIGIILILFSLFHMAKTSWFNKEDNKEPDRASQNQTLKDNEDNDFKNKIPDEVKETLDDYCNLVDEEGLFISPKSKGDKFEMCSNYQCMTTVDDNGSIIYYIKNCKGEEYKRMSKEDLDLINMVDEACKNLDEFGNYEAKDNENNTSIVCTSYACEIDYNNGLYYRTCVK